MALCRVGLACLGLAAVTLPFYAYDPDGFTPLTTSGKLSQFDVLAPHLHVYVLTASVLLTLGLALRRFDRAGFLVMTSAAIVQIYFLVAAVLFDSVEAGRADFSFLIPSYGLMALFFAIFGTWGPWSRYRPGTATAS